MDVYKNALQNAYLQNRKFSSNAVDQCERIQMDNCLERINTTEIDIFSYVCVSNVNAQKQLLLSGFLYTIAAL